MDKINCLIVDDEPIARDILENYCRQLGSLSITGICSDALAAKAILQNQPVDILFLDINMPVLDGISFAKTLRHQPQIISLRHTRNLRRMLLIWQPAIIC